MIRKLSFIVLLLIASAPLTRATHILGAYLTYKVEDTGFFTQRVTVKVHVYRNTQTSNINVNTVYWSGPYGGGHVSNNNTTNRFSGNVGRPNCSDPSIEEVVFTLTRNYDNSIRSLGQGITLSFNLTCCLASTNNLIIDSRVPLHLVLEGDSATNKLKISDVSDWDYPAVPLRYMDEPQQINYSLGFLPRNVDSVAVKLAPINDPNTNSTAFQSGYTYLNPLPDPTEDSLNAQNVFDTLTGIFSFNSRSVNSNPGYYSLSHRYEFYQNGELLSTMSAFGAVWLKSGQDSIKSNFTLEMRAGNEVWRNISNRPVVDTIELFNFDSLALDLRAFHPQGDSLEVLKFNFLPSQDYLSSAYSTPSFNPPSVHSQNPGGSFIKGDTNQVQIRWKPNLSYFFAEQKLHKITLELEPVDCAAKPILVELFVKLINKPGILWHGNRRDSIAVCRSGSTVMSSCFFDSTLTWEPRHFFDNPNSPTPTMSPDSSRFIFLVDSLGNKLDSIYVNSASNPRADVTLNVVNTSPNVKLAYIDPILSLYQKWTWNDRITFFGQKEDVFDVLSNGTFHVNYLNTGDTCIKFSDTVLIDSDFKYAANHGIGNYEVAQVYNDTIPIGDTVRYHQTITLYRNSPLSFYRIAVYGIENLEPQKLKDLKFKLRQPDGVEVEIKSIRKQFGYFEFIRVFDWSSRLDSIVIELQVPGGMVMQLLEGSGNPVPIKGIEYSNFKTVTRSAGTDISEIGNRRLALGLEFAGRLDQNEMPIENHLKLYPNPSTGLVQVELPGNLEAENRMYAVINCKGQVLMSGEFLKTLNELDLSQQPKGLYILKVGNLQQRFVIN
jgi:hypothetical protein